MRQATDELSIETPGRSLVDVTGEVSAFVRRAGVAEGLLTVFCRHTSASLLIQENADPDVLADLDSFLTRLAPEDRSLYRHNAEGPDDMPSHIRAALTQTQLSIPMIEGRLALGTWQSIALLDPNADNPERTVLLSFLSG